MGKANAKGDGHKEERQPAQRGSQGGLPGVAPIKLKPNEEIGVCKADGSRGNSRQRAQHKTGRASECSGSRDEGVGHTAAL